MMLITTKTKQSKYNPKLYKRADYPGEKIQVDVKFVPSYCVANGDKYYQYTAIAEYTKYNKFLIKFLLTTRRLQCIISLLCNKCKSLVCICFEVWRSW